MLPRKMLEKLFIEVFKEARRGINNGHGGPFGALIVRDGKIISRGHNTVTKDNDPTRHAEMNAIAKAAESLKDPHLEDCILITTSEPCPMCLAAAYWARIEEIHYGLSKAAAARAGFDDGFIYEEFLKVASKRKIKMFYFKDRQKEGQAVFAEWKKLGGRLY